ncbi:MAG: hypothetical protein HYY18_05970 [Planctomycetes bacterium]|nr:hypothetical protein [Planctomycetota bacterium]
MNARGFAMLAAFATGAAGFIGGFLLARSMPAPGDGALAGVAATGSPGYAPGSATGPAALEERLRKAEAGIASLRARTPGGPARGPGLDKLRAQIGPLVAGHRGRELILLMRDLVATGEEAYLDAVGIWRELLEDEEFGLSGSGLGVALQIWMQPLVRWTLASPARAPQAVRVQAAQSILVADPRVALEFLRGEGDHEVAMWLGNSLGWSMTEGMIPDFEAAVRAHAGDPKTVATMLAAINRIEGDTATTSLLALSTDADPVVREEARVRLLIRRPPATGLLLLERLEEGSALYAAGMRRGDIVVGVGDAPLEYFEAWYERIAPHTDSDAPQTLTINRAGTTLTFRIPGRDLPGFGASEFVRASR